MALKFRNVDALPTDPVNTWPYEALVTAIERGLVPDWHPIFDELKRDPWGPVSRKIERYLSYAPVDGFTTLFRLAIERARSNAENRERAEVAEQVRSAIAASGLTAAQFAERIGTSASRLSTYATGAVTPSSHLLLRIEQCAKPSTAPRSATR
ncbi:MAG: helix-turn-helix transcriptional regulator [Actinobacteria bacterium]|nr:helix-turn-helix transcriptional regulator [Actinomycetota bacterium]